MGPNPLPAFAGRGEKHLTIYSYRTISLSALNLKGGNHVHRVPILVDQCAAPAGGDPRNHLHRGLHGRPSGITTRAPSMAYNFSGKQTGLSAGTSGFRAMQDPEAESLRHARATACRKWTPCDLELWKICHADTRRCVPAPPSSSPRRKPGSETDSGFRRNDGTGGQSGPAPFFPQNFDRREARTESYPPPSNTGKRGRLALSPAFHRELRLNRSLRLRAAARPPDRCG